MQIDLTLREVMYLEAVLQTAVDTRQGTGLSNGENTAQAILDKLGREN